MRIRSLTCAVVTALASVALLAAPASAGTGSSTWCGDGIGEHEIPILTSPVTVGVEVDRAGPDPQVVVCYGTGAVGQPNTGTGGTILLDVYTTASTAYPGAYVALFCTPDYVSGFAPSCGLVNSADLALDDVVVNRPPNAVCLVAVGSGCAAYVPGVQIGDGNPNRALLQLVVLGTPVSTPNPTCVAVLVSCP